jgi:hypothetical protein
MHVLGKSFDEFMQTWKREAEFVLGARAKEGFNVELFKVAAERKVNGVGLGRVVREVC